MNEDQYVEINLTVGEYSEGQPLRAKVPEHMRPDDEHAYWELHEALDAALVGVLKGWVEDYARAVGDL